jgi:hypothetical protein
VGGLCSSSELEGQEGAALGLLRRRHIIAGHAGEVAPPLTLGLEDR